MTNGPIFIAGTDRAGKTLLSALLASHPRISIPAVGSNMWTLFYRRFGDLADARNFERCLNALQHYKHVLFFAPDVARLRREFVAGKPSYARLFALIQEQSAERARKPRWGDQTGLIEGYAGDVLAAYPDAVMLHMLRDPRDRYDASLTMWPEGRLRVGGATARWIYSAGHARRNQQRHGGRYRVIRYEDLVADPARLLGEICDFLDEPFVPEMLGMAGMPTYRDRLARDAVGGALITTSYIGTYRGRIPARELAFLESRAGGLMREFGYQPDGTALSGADRLRYALVDLPLNLGRMTTWRVRQAAAQRLPRIAGRTPPSHHLVSDAV
jgi:hypothetical protein